MQERREKILKALDERGEVRVAELSKNLGCSEMTIRSDIKWLDEKGLLKRVHGGAIRLEDQPVQIVRKYAGESLYRNVEQKRKIAQCAYEYINAFDTIMLDDASSSFYLAETIRLHPEKQLAVVTNSLPIGNELSGLEHIDLFMIGGHVGGRVAATMGDEAIMSIQAFHIDKAFIGVHGINFEAGLTSIATPQMQIKHAILKSSTEVYVLADSSKFGGGYLSVICPIDRVHRIITDAGVSEANRTLAEAKKVPLIIAE